MARVTAKERFKQMPCRVCGKPIEVGSNTRNAPRCFECGLKRGIDAMQQMINKSGPDYDKWLAGMKVFIEREGRARGGG